MSVLRLWSSVLRFVQPTHANRSACYWVDTGSYVPILTNLNSGRLVFAAGAEICPMDPDTPPHYNPLYREGFNPPSGLASRVEIGRALLNLKFYALWKG